MEKILLGMSGGVDSSAAALLLKEQGYEVLGVTLLLRPDAVPDDPAGDAADARRVADALGIEHRTVDLRETFRRDVIEYFTAEYAAGRTPNPCVACNRRIKFGAMLDLALEYGCDGVATGHYARVERDPASGRWLLLRAPTPKDQSYVLYQLMQRQLSRAVFPLAAYAKPEIRALAQRAGLPVANRPDSQEICFVPGDDYGAFLQSRGIRPAPGSFVGLDGEILGTHRGIPFYTVGQRKGLGISFGRPMYVTKIDAARNEITLGPEGSQYSASAVVSGVNWIPWETPPERLRAQVKARYQARPAAAEITPLPDGRALIRFDEPQRAVTPGQSAVFYDGDLVLGGGVICEKEGEQGVNLYQ